MQEVLEVQMQVIEKIQVCYENQQQQRGLDSKPSIIIVFQRHTKMKKCIISDPGNQLDELITVI